MKNLEKQVGKIFKMLGKIQDHQIKGECQLTNLARGVDFITQKFESMQDAIIATLQSHLKSVRMKAEGMEKKMDRQEQYSEINGLKEEN